MLRCRVLLLLKPFEVYPPSFASSSYLSSSTRAKILSYLNDRFKVHEDTIKLCKDVLRRKNLDWELVMRNNLSGPIRNFDLVVTVGGDGTLLRASHFIDDKIPVLGVNSDPTQPEEVDKYSREFDATRSTGYLCASTAANFEQVLDEILVGDKKPLELARISMSVNSRPLPTYALNDVLVAHPCPAALSRFSFRILDGGGGEGQDGSSLWIHCRSSGVRVCTAAGSTAAMLSSGGFEMPVSSKGMQYMVREPIPPRSGCTPPPRPPLCGRLETDQYLNVAWHSKEGFLYVDGSHVSHPIKNGDAVVFSSVAPGLNVFLGAD